MIVTSTRARAWVVAGAAALAFASAHALETPPADSRLAPVIEVQRTEEIVLAPGTVPSNADEQTPCPATGELPAASLVEPSVLHSPLHSVAPCARIVGHMAQFDIHTAYGDLTADSVELLAVRVRELPALARLTEITRGEQFLESASHRGKKTVGGVGRVITRPWQTIKALPAGAIRFLRARWRGIQGQTRKLSDRVSDQITGADEAYDQPSARPGAVEPRDPADPWWRQQGRRGTRWALDYVGYATQRREWARRFGIDPYSSNVLLDEEMDRLAWAALAGDKSVGLALSAIGGVSADVLSTSLRLNEVVWTMPAADIADRNHQRLSALACGEEEIRRFLRNGRFSSSMQTRLVDALVSLQVERGCVDVIELAAALRGEGEARYLAATMSLLAARAQDSFAQLKRDVEPAPSRHRALEAPRDPNQPLAIDIVGQELGRIRLQLIGTAPALVDDAGRIVLPLAVDYLQWTEATARFFDQKAFRVPRKQVLIAGRASPNALRALTRRGWLIEEGARYPDAPPYRR